MSDDPHRHDELDDALYDLALTRGVPDAETVERIAQRYPDQADALRQAAQAFALEMVPGEEPLGEMASPPPSVSAAMAVFYAKLEEPQDDGTKRQPLEATRR